jgi:hypothetical protein
MVDVPKRTIALFDELIARGELIKDICKKIYFSGGKKTIDLQSFEAWRTSCMTLLRSTFGTSSPHYDSFINLKFFDHYNSTLLYLGILQGARDDIKNGYFYHKDLMLSVNIFNSFLSRANALFQAGETVKAVGLMEAVMQEAVKKLAETQGCANDSTDGVMGLTNALKQSGTISGETRDSLAELCSYTAAPDGEGGSQAIFAQWHSWVQKFLYEYLGSRIVIVN